MDFGPQINITTDDIQLGDKYVNSKYPDKHGIRIATEQTIKTVKFTKAIAYGICYLQKVK